MAMTTSEILTALFDLPDAGDGSDLVAFLKHHGPSPAAETSEDPFERLVRVASHADRRSAASIAGHQAAIRRLFPNTPPDAICAFCISEDRGPHPKYIFTALRSTDAGHRILAGTKRWGSVAPDADVLYVAASVGRHGDHNELRMVAVPTDRPGISLDLTPYVDYGPEMRIADITFDEVEVAEDEILAGDAYLTYIKPFRLIEDVYNTAGVQIGLFRVGLDHGWSDDRLESLVGLICQAGAISSTDMASPEAVLLLSDYLRASAVYWETTWSSWADAPPDVVQRWRPDRGLLDVAARARDARRTNAWSQLRG